MKVRIYEVKVQGSNDVPETLVGHVKAITFPGRALPGYEVTFKVSGAALLNAMECAHTNKSFEWDGTQSMSTGAKRISEQKMSTILSNLRLCRIGIGIPFCAVNYINKNGYMVTHALHGEEFDQAMEALFKEEPFKPSGV